MTKKSDIACDKILKTELRKEWDAIEGTLIDLQRFTSDPVIIDRCRTMIWHARILGNIETAIRRGVNP